MNIERKLVGILMQKLNNRGEYKYYQNLTNCMLSTVRIGYIWIHKINILEYIYTLDHLW
jgi:hypothetical protein